MRDIGTTEIGAFAISAADDPLLVETVELVEQECTPTSVAFFDDAVADFIDGQLDAGVLLERCARIWLHTHPDDSPLPSPKDEATFARVFGRCDWAVMAILARSGHAYARLRFSPGPGGQLRIPLEIDYSREFAASDHAAWEHEYARCVHAWMQPAAWHEPVSFSALDAWSSRHDSYELDATNEFPF